MKGSVHIGTSGWSYDWGKFYESIPKPKRLWYISRKFNTAEVNYSFYRLPRRSTLKKWYKETPDDFIFSVKLSRYITHIKRLKNSKTAFRKFFKRISALGEKLGPILIQLPPNFKADPKRIDKFLKDARDVSKGKTRLAVEPRDKSWFEKEPLEIFKRHKAALVFSDGEKFPYPKEEPITADFIYIRLHGPGKIYASKYKEKDLEKWGKKIRVWKRKNLGVFVYFDNDSYEYAPMNANSLKTTLGG